MNTTKKNSKAVIRIVFSMTALAIVVFVVGTGLSSLLTEDTVKVVEDTTMAVSHYAEILAERIDDTLVKPGTIEQINQAGAAIFADARIEAEAQVNAYFDSMVSRTDSYLDWYYSMSGQWAQMFNMGLDAISGDFEEQFGAYIGEKMAEYMDPSIDFEGNVKAIYDSAKNEFISTARRIIDENRISVDSQGNVKISYIMSFNDVVEQAMPENIKNNPVRTAAASAAGGVAGGYLAKKLAKKVVAKTATRTATKVATGTLSKFLGVLGGPIGMVTIGLGIDYLGTAIDEALNREDYKASIIEIINAERGEYLNLIEGYFDAAEFTSSQIAG